MAPPNLKFHITGSLRTWSVIPRVHEITARTLVINGRYDEAQDSVLQPSKAKISNMK
jgi:microcompartment protein CcmL/EutN